MGSITNKTEQIYKIYEECKKIFELSVEWSNEICNMEDEAEKDFYVKVSNSFLQQKQKEVIKNKRY